jgi:hypothetical protein
LFFGHQYQERERRLSGTRTMYAVPMALLFDCADEARMLLVRERPYSYRNGRGCSLP